MPSSPTFRWRIAWLLGAGVLVNYFDRVNLSVSHDALVASFGISDITFGFLAAAYNWTYALCQLPCGMLLDRWGVRRVGRISSFIWSLASFAAAAATGVRSFTAARLLLGIGEAPTFPANAKAIAAWFPAQERSFATSIFDSAAKFANAIGVPLLGFLVLSIGWRRSFAVTGVLSLLYFAAFFLVYRDPAPETHAANTAAHQEVPAAHIPELPLSTLLANRKVLGLAIGSGSYNYLFYLLLTWLPTYLSRTLHVNLLHSFLYTGVPWLLAAVTDFTIGGLFVDWLLRRGYNPARVRKTVLLCGMSCGFATFGAIHPHSLTQALVCISVANAGMAAAIPITWTLPALLTGPRNTGKVASIANLSNQLSGITAPILTGYVIAATHSFATAFAIAAGYLLLGFLAYIFLLGRIEPIRLPESPALPA